MIAIGRHVCWVIISKGRPDAWHVPWIKIMAETAAAMKEQETGYEMRQMTTVRPSTVYVRVSATRLHRVTRGERDLWIKTRLTTGVREGEIPTDEGGIEYEHGKNGSMTEETENNKWCST